MLRNSTVFFRKFQVKSDPFSRIHIRYNTYIPYPETVSLDKESSQNHDVH